jgi:protein-S-isoprenylcysteine O-methyltransferase Ste14
MNPLLRILPPIWFFLLLGMGLLVHLYLPAARVFTYPYPVAGILLVFAGLVLSMYASSLFSKEKTEILPTSASNSKLVTYGPFTYTRNPMYLGLVLQLLGAAIWVGTLPLFIATTAYFFLFNFVFIPFEEAKMSRIFAQDYDAYRRKVRRWL